jgi:hypothetical protein
MSKSKRKASLSLPAQAKPVWRRSAVIACIAVLAVGIGFAAVYWLQKNAADFQTLRGRWLRPDGGYVLEIRNVDPNGVIDAAYFNPQPIHIGKAEAARSGENMTVAVELRAPNYPGSTYKLTYDSQNDTLRGNYFQAMERQNFDVVFVRMK